MVLLIKFYNIMIYFIKNLFNKNKKLSYKDGELYYRDRINKKFIVKKDNRLNLTIIYVDNIDIKDNLINIMYLVFACSGFYLNNQYCGSSTLLNLFFFIVLCVVFLSDGVFRKNDVTKNKISSKKELLEFLDKNI